MIMNNQLSQKLTYILRIIAWAFNYLVIWPIAATVLITVLLFWRDNTTLGTEIVHAVIPAKIEAYSDEFLITRCHVTPSEVTKRAAPVPNPICEKQTIKVNAREYASHLDRKLWSLIKVLWVTMAAVFGLVAFCLRTFPAFLSGAHALYAYGIERKVFSEAKETA